MDRDVLIYSRAGSTAKMNKKRFPGVYYQAVFFFCICDRLYSFSFYSICFLKTALKFHSI